MKIGSRPVSPRSSTAPTADFVALRRWLVPWMILLLLLYWVFVWYMERIDLSYQVNQWWQGILPGATVPGLFVTVWEFVQLRVLRHLIPVAVGWWLAAGGAVSLIQRLYHLPDRAGAQLYLNLLRAGDVAGKALLVQGKTLALDRPKSVLLRVGGPGKIQIVNEEVGVTERNGRFYRILGPGIHRLLPFEYLYTLLDLRPQERSATGVPLVTREGIEITADINLTYRINTGHEPITRAKPYPFDPHAVRTIAYAQIALEDRIANWEEIPLNVARSKLTQIVARHYLDELLHPSSPAYEPYLTIRNELERQARAALLNDYGIELINVHIGRLELPTAVTQQYIKYWETHLQRQIQLNQIDGTATSMHEIELARAEAELVMIQGILEGVQRAQREGNMNTVREVVALRLVEALEKMAQQSQLTQPLPNRLLPQLANLRQQLLPEGSQGTQ